MSYSFKPLSKVSRILDRGLDWCFPGVGELGGLNSDSFLKQAVASKGKADLGNTCTCVNMGQRHMALRERRNSKETQERNVN